MKLIVGLGNPGNIYANTRHNIGSSVVKALAKSHKIFFKKENSASSLNAKARLDGKNVILALPLTFMNLSGVALAGLVKKYKIDLDNLLVVCDDLDLEFGRLKLRPAGSSGGHKGLESIIEYLGSDGFSRLRIGIGRPVGYSDASDYVLSHFSKREKEQISRMINQASLCCESWVTNGIIETMNSFNKRSKQNEQI